MMDIGAVYVEIIILMILLLQLCVDNLDTLQQVSGYTCIEGHTGFYAFIFPGWIINNYYYYYWYEELPFLPSILDDLSCTGNEATLLDCCHFGGLHNCYSTIVIQCAGIFIEEVVGITAVQRFTES